MWNRQFYGRGSFQIECPYNDHNKEIFDPDGLVTFDDSGEFGIIRDYTLRSDEELGDILQIKGTLGKSVYADRVIYDITQFTAQDVGYIFEYMSEISFVSGVAETRRVIPNFVVNSTTTGFVYSVQPSRGQNLFDFKGVIGGEKIEPFGEDFGFEDG